MNGVKWSHKVYFFFLLIKWLPGLNQSSPVWSTQLAPGFLRPGSNPSGVPPGLRVLGRFSVFEFIVLAHSLNVGTTPMNHQCPQTCSDIYEIMVLVQNKCSINLVHVKPKGVAQRLHLRWIPCIYKIPCTFPSFHRGQLGHMKLWSCTERCLANCPARSVLWTQKSNHGIPTSTISFRTSG